MAHNPHLPWDKDANAQPVAGLEGGNARSMSDSAFHFDTAASVRWNGVQGSKQLSIVSLQSSACLRRLCQPCLLQTTDRGPPASIPRSHFQHDSSCIFLLSTTDFAMFFCADCANPVSLLACIGKTVLWNLRFAAWVVATSQRTYWDLCMRYASGQNPMRLERPSVTYTDQRTSQRILARHLPVSSCHCRAADATVLDSTLTAIARRLGLSTKTGAISLPSSRCADGRGR